LAEGRYTTAVKEELMSKIFVRERRNVGRGSGTPRFEIVAVTGVDLRVYHSHVRKVEVEKIASDLAAEIVYLPRGEGEGEAAQEGRGRKRGRGGGRREEQD
jgi:hypothetical protein